MAPENEINIQEVMAGIRQRVEARKEKGEAVAPVRGSARPQANVAERTPQLYPLVQMESRIASARVAQTEIGTINPRRPGFHNNLIQLFKKAIRRSLSWYTRPLMRFHSAVVDSLAEVASAMKSFQASLLDLRRSHSDAISGLRDQEQKLQGLQNQFLELQGRQNVELQSVHNQFLERQGRQNVELQGIQNQFTELRTQVLGAADTHLGAKARNGLWFNEPIALQYDSAGQPSWSSTTERIIERAWVLRHLSDVPAGAKILDLGCSESTLGLELASNGFNVVGIDVRNHPLTHPNFKFIQQDICESKLPENTFDAAIALSTIEHIGLGAYGDSKGEGLDRVAMKEVYRILKPGGVLLLTTPFGKPAVTSLHRIFDSNGLRALLVGFDIRLLEFGIKVDKKTWISPVNESQADRDLDSGLGPGAVALVKAYKTQLRN
jgi:SAM-dependent methyltransferase